MRYHTERGTRINAFFVGAKHGSSASPAFDHRGSKGEAR